MANKLKPQFVASDLSGHHAANLDQTASRLHKGGSWKKQRIVVILPTGDTVPMKCVMAWWNLAFPPNNGVIKVAAVGYEVGEAYSLAIANILADPTFGQWEFVLTIEHDNAPPVDGVIRLVDQMELHPEFSAIGGLYFTKGPGGCAQIWGDPMDPTLNYRPQVPKLDGSVQECCGTAMGFTLYRLAMFKDERIEKPWFKTLRGEGGQGVGTQDLTFWNSARKYGYRCAIDTSVRVGHYDLNGDFGIPDFMW